MTMDAQNLVRVYRVQDAEGRGPFRPGFSKWWVEERADQENMHPWTWEFGLDAIPKAKGWHVGCACRTLGQLRRWFTSSEYVTLQRFGFHAVSMEANRVLHESEIQLLFQRAKPLRADVSHVDLYGQNVGIEPPKVGSNDWLGP
jgi:hypothetical protein